MVVSGFSLIGVLFEMPESPMNTGFLREGIFRLENIVPFPKQARYQTAPRPDVIFLMIFLGFYIRSENLIFQADFLILNLCGVHVVVANFSLISGIS